MNKLVTTGIGVGAVAIGLYAGVSIYTSKVAEAKVDEFIAEVDDAAIIEYGSAKVNLMGANLTISDISIAPAESPEQVVNIDKIIIREFDDKAEFPTVFDASVKGIQVDASQASTAMVTPFLAQAGYDQSLLLDLDTRYTYEEASGEITLDEFRLGADDFGYFEVTFKLSNFDPEATTNDALTLHSAEIVYQDDSFVENLLASMAAQSNQDIKQFKTQLTSGISQNAQFFVSTDNPTAMTAIDETVAFIQKPEGFRIAANPSQPIAVSELTAATNPEAWMTMLNLEIQSF